MDAGPIEPEAEMDLIEPLDMIHMRKYLNLVRKCLFFSTLLFLLYKSLTSTLKSLTAQFSRLLLWNSGEIILIHDSILTISYATESSVLNMQ